MAILIKNPQYHFLVLGLFLIMHLSCTINKKKNSNIIPSIDSFKTNVDANKLFNSETIAKGIHYITLTNDSTYFVLPNNNSIIIMDILDSSKKILINGNLNIEQLVCKDSSIICFDFTNNIFTKVTILNGDINKRLMSTSKIPKIFDDYIFCYSAYSAPLLAIDTNSFLIPYRVYNESPNMTDSFSTIFLRKEKNEYHFSKIIPFADYIQRGYDYYKSTLLSYDLKSNKIFYTFQKSNFLYSINIKTNRIDSVMLENFQSKDYDSTKITDFTYLREYMADVDINTNILVDNNSRILIIKKNNLSNKSKSEISIFDNNLKKLANYETPNELFGTFSFEKNNKLYILNSKKQYNIFNFSN